MWIYCATALSVAVLAEGALLGSNKCTWGPSYWCQSFANAKGCSATQHCLENVWGKVKTHNEFLGYTPNPSAGDSDVCIFCKDIVSDVKNLLESNQTQAKVLSYLNRACSVIPGDFAEKCKDIAAKYLDEFEKLIQNDVDPNVICEYLQMCQSAVEKEAPNVIDMQPVSAAQLSRAILTKSSSVALTDYPMCDMCKTMMGALKSAISDPKNQDAIKNFMLNECTQLGDMAAECQTFVNNYMPEVFVFLEMELGDQMCVMFTLCPNSTGGQTEAVFNARLYNWLRVSSLVHHMRDMSVRIKSDECQTCEMIAGYIKIFLSNQQMEQEVEQALEKVICQQLGPVAGLCDELIKTELPNLYNKLLELLDPATLCTELGLCSNSTQAAVKLVPAKQTKAHAEASPQCILCEFLIDKLKSMLSDNSTQSEIEAALQKVCTLLPKSVSDQCNALVQQYGPEIINLLLSDIQPDQICAMIKLCASKLDKFGDNCMVCELAMSYVISQLSKNATAQEIEQALQKVCSYLYDDLAQQCRAMIDQNLPEILKMLATDLKPKDICTKLGMCAAERFKPDGRVHLYKYSNE